MTSTLATHLTCLCGAIQAPGSLLSDPEIPTSSEFCHCNSCRHAIGSLGATFPLLKSSPSQEVLSSLKAYHSSEKVTRYFCGVCGCHCFFLNRLQNKWYCLGGIIEPSSTGLSSTVWPKDTVKVIRQEYVFDTIDGGLAPLLLNLGDRSIPAWGAGRLKTAHTDASGLAPAAILSLPGSSKSASQPLEDVSYLGVECHCSGVNLAIRQANYCHDNHGAEAARHLPKDPRKYLTYMCACRSCRLSTGVSLVPWTLVPPANVFNANAPRLSSKPDSMVPVVFGEAASESGANPALRLKHYWSSRDVCRSFCDQCGATVFYWCAQRPDELDVAVGLVRSAEGSMARTWLEWEWGRCSFPEESIDTELCDAWRTKPPPGFE